MANFCIQEDANGISIEITDIAGGYSVAERVRERLLVQGNDDVKAMIMAGADHKTRVVALGYKPSEVYGALQRALHLDLNHRRKAAEAQYEGLLIGLRKAYHMDDSPAAYGYPTSKHLALYYVSPSKPGKPDSSAYAPTPELVGLDGRWAAVPDRWFTNEAEAEATKSVMGDKVWISVAKASWGHSAWAIFSWNEPVLAGKNG